MVVLMLLSAMLCLTSHRRGALQEEYAAEGIDWSYVEFIDNQDCLDLLEGSPVNPSLAVFPLIDEACRMPRATYQVKCMICGAPETANMAAGPQLVLVRYCDLMDLFAPCARTATHLPLTALHDHHV